MRLLRSARNDKVVSYSRYVRWPCVTRRLTCDRVLLRSCDNAPTSPIHHLVSLPRGVTSDAEGPKVMPVVHRDENRRLWLADTVPTAFASQITEDASGHRLWVLLTSRRPVARNQERSAGSTATEDSWGADIPGGSLSPALVAMLCVATPARTLQRHQQTVLRNDSAHFAATKRTDAPPPKKMTGRSATY